MIVQRCVVWLRTLLSLCLFAACQNAPAAKAKESCAGTDYCFLKASVASDTTTVITDRIEIKRLVNISFTLGGYADAPIAAAAVREVTVAGPAGVWKLRLDEQLQRLKTPAGTPPMFGWGITEGAQLDVKRFAEGDVYEFSVTDPASSLKFSTPVGKVSWEPLPLLAPFSIATLSAQSLPLVLPITNGTLRVSWPAGESDRDWGVLSPTGRVYAGKDLDGDGFTLSGLNAGTEYEVDVSAGRPNVALSFRFTAQAGGR